MFSDPREKRRNRRRFIDRINRFAKTEFCCKADGPDLDRLREDDTHLERLWKETRDFSDDRFDRFIDFLLRTKSEAVVLPIVKQDDAAENAEWRERAIAFDRLFALLRDDATGATAEAAELRGHCEWLGHYI